MHLRRYEPADAMRCCDVINAAIMVMDGLNDAARALVKANNVPERLGADLEQWITVVVESEEGRVVGLGALDGDEAKRIYVDPAAQGQGAARHLMSALETSASARGFNRVWLEASPSSVGFYGSLGYIAGRTGHLEVGEASFRFVHMTKDL